MVQLDLENVYLTVSNLEPDDEKKLWVKDNRYLKQYKMAQKIYCFIIYKP